MNFNVVKSGKIIGIESLDRAKWSAFVKNHPEGNIFQTPEFYEAVQFEKSQQPFLIGCQSEQGELLGILQGLQLRSPILLNYLPQ